MLLSGIFFSWKVAQIFRVTVWETTSERRYVVEGQLFFASAQDFLAAMDFKSPARRVVIEVPKAHMDLTGVGAIDTAVLKFRKAGATVEVVGLNEASTTINAGLLVYTIKQTWGVIRKISSAPGNAAMLLDPHPGATH